VNFKVDVGDYMGAMRANKIARAVAERLQEGVGREPTSYICSNHLAGRQVIAQAYVPWSAISTKTGNAIQGMQQWADMDAYRSTTHIKGILNGIMGVCRATGQDEEAVMAAILSQIVKSPEKTFTKYHYSSDGLKCQLSMKLPVATEGGATQDTFARMCLALMGVSSVDDLLPIAACAGLATNISALRCLPEEGIIEAFKAVEED
jgi:hydroxymethylglutaryl-CoA reductase